MNKHQATKTEEYPRWVREMASKHAAHILSHEFSYGANLGQLRKEPTKKDLDDAYERFLAEKNNSRMPKKKTSQKKPSHRPSPSQRKDE